ncbi:hypothetical protein GT347_20160 [Xylophilus rhododendri]|uniref:Uncharacterized protein n=1 Tax=Xylophilus rhododendri TaxID=2697032 RepID=A0A857JAM2_9BURK|nr:hypothetical protein [Xylophilus rhododendri]QHJ00090.1 hypothetical protein GT347_20160 [Xylophilus rhododendri]
MALALFAICASRCIRTLSGHHPMRRLDFLAVVGLVYGVCHAAAGF